MILSEFIVTFAGVFSPAAAFFRSICGRRGQRMLLPWGVCTHLLITARKSLEVCASLRLQLHRVQPRNRKVCCCAQRHIEGSVWNILILNFTSHWRPHWGIFNTSTLTWMNTTLSLRLQDNSMKFILDQCRSITYEMVEMTTFQKHKFLQKAFDRWLWMLLP